MRLHVATIGPELPEAFCDGSYTCACERCTAERADRVARGVLPLKRQPYQPQPSRIAA
jgi:hypothetical protein